MGKKRHVPTGIEEGYPFTRLFGIPLSCHLKHSETQELPQACYPPGFRFPESWLGGNSSGYYRDNTHGHSSCFHSQPWWHPGHEVLLPNLPQQHHRVFRWPCPLCLLLSGQPVQSQCCLRSDWQPWGSMGQCLYQPTVGAASSCLVRAWVAFLYHRGSVWSLSSILLQPRLFPSLSLSALTPRHIRSSLLSQKGSNTCPTGSCPGAQLSRLRKSSNRAQGHTSPRLSSL